MLLELTLIALHCVAVHYTTSNHYVAQRVFSSQDLFEGRTGELVEQNMEPACAGARDLARCGKMSRQRLAPRIPHVAKRGYHFA